MATAKTRAKRHSLVQKGWRTQVPRFNILDYKLSMIKVMSFFASDVENKDKQEMTLAFWKAQKKDVSGISRMSDGLFSQTAALVYLTESGVDLEPHDALYLERKYKELKSKVKPVVETEKPKKIKPPKEDKDREIAIKAGTVIDEELSNAFTAKGKYEFDIKNFLLKSEVTPGATKIIASFYVNTLKELTLAAEEYQYEEAYSFLGKVGLRRMTDFVQSIIDACQTASTIVKTTRKPRKTKEKPAAVLAAKMKYLKEHAEFNLKSITPDKIISMSEVWLFNVKYRKLFHYVAQEGMLLSIKGSTIQNFDPEKSGAKTIRKPEIFFPGVIDQTKRVWSKSFTDIKSVMAKATGRVNEESLILKVF